MEQITQSTEYVYMFPLVDETDDETNETGKTPTLQISKAGGVFAGATNSITEVSNGWYKVTFTTTETNTVGGIAIRAWATGTNEWKDKVQVVAAQGAVSVTLTTAQYNQIADHVLRRTMANVEASSDGDAVSQHALIGAVLKVAGHTEIVSGSPDQLTVYKADETTTFYTQDVTTDASADLIIEVH